MHVQDVDAGEEVLAGSRRFPYSIDVEDLAAAFSDVRPRREAAAMKVHGPVDQEYGRASSW